MEQSEYPQLIASKFEDQKIGRFLNHLLKGLRHISWPSYGAVCQQGDGLTHLRGKVFRGRFIAFRYVVKGGGKLINGLSRP